MQVEFTLELFGYSITDTIDIPEADLNSIPKDEQHDFIYEYINDEINNNIQLYVEEPTRDDE